MNAPWLPRAGRSRALAIASDRPRRMRSCAGLPTTVWSRSRTWIARRRPCSPRPEIADMAIAADPGLRVPRVAPGSTGSFKPLVEPRGASAHIGMGRARHIAIGWQGSSSDLRNRNRSYASSYASLLHSSRPERVNKIAPPLICRYQPDPEVRRTSRLEGRFVAKPGQKKLANRWMCSRSI